MKTIYLDLDEEITSVIDRIRHITDREIILVIPQRALILQSLVNLKLLKNQADILGRKVIIVTADELGRHLASRAGLEVREKVGNQAILTTAIETPPREVKKETRKKEEKTDFAPSGESLDRFAAVSVVDIVRRARSSRLYPLKKKIKEGRRRSSFRSKLWPARRARKERYPRVRRRGRRVSVKLSSFSAKVGLGFIALSSILILLIVLLILPKATINIFVKTEPLSQNVNIVVRTEGQEGEGLTGAIVGELLVLEKQESRIFKTSGKRTISEKARGEVTLYNELGVSQLLVATTRLMSEENILFRTQEQVVVPPATVSPNGEIVPGTIKVKVIADTPGLQGNIGPSEFYIVAFSESKRQKIYGKSSEPFSGGASQEINVVSEEDLTTSKDTIKENLISMAKEEIKADLGAELELPEAAMQGEIVETKSSKAVGEEADNFEMTVKVQLKALVFSPQKVKELALNTVLGILKPDQYIIDFSEKGITYNLESVDLANKKALLNVHIEKEVAWKIDTEAIKKQISGKREEEVLKYLNSLEKVERAEVALWPFWVKKVPTLDKKIEINIKKEN